MTRPEGVFLDPGNESRALAGPSIKHVVVVVAPIHDDERSLRKLELLGDADIRDLAFGDDGERRQMPVVVEEQVEFGRAHGGTELRPVEHRRAKLDDGAVQRVAELLSRRVHGDSAK